MSKAVDDLNIELKKVESLENDLEMILQAFSGMMQAEQKRFERKIAETVGFQKGAFSEAGKKIAALIEDNRRTQEELSGLRAERKKEYAKWMAHVRKQEEKVFHLQSENLQLDGQLKECAAQVQKAGEKDRQIADLQAEIRKLQGQLSTERFEAANLKTERDELRKREKEYRTEIERLKKLAQGHYQMLDSKQEEIAEKDRAYKRLANHLGEIQKLSFELKTSSHEKEKDLYKYRNDLRDKNDELERVKSRNDELSHLLLKHKERIAQLLEFNREQNNKVEHLYRELCEERSRNSRLQAEAGALKTRSLFWDEGREPRRQDSAKEIRSALDEMELDFVEGKKDSSDRSIF